MTIFLSILQIKYDFKWFALPEPEKGESSTAETALSHSRQADESFTSDTERKHLPILNVNLSFFFPVLF